MTKILITYKRLQPQIEDFPGQTMKQLEKFFKGIPAVTKIECL